MNGYERRTYEKKQQVLDAAFQLMNSDTGIETLTMDEVAKHAKVGKTTIFNYFGSKEKLIGEVFKQFVHTMAVEAREIMAKNLPFRESLIEMSQTKIRFLDTITKTFYLDLMAYYTEEVDKELTRLLQEYNQETLNIMLDLFHRGRKEGTVDLKYSDEFLLLYFQAIVEGISSPAVYEKIFPYTADWTEVMIKGLAPS